MLDHLCRRRDWVNPAHLDVVTVGENTARGEAGVGRRNARDRDLAAALVALRIADGDPNDPRVATVRAWLTYQRRRERRDGQRAGRAEAGGPLLRLAPNPTEDR